jgi:hypothetical protein
MILLPSSVVNYWMRRLKVNGNNQGQQRKNNKIPDEDMSFFHNRSSSL